MSAKWPALACLATAAALAGCSTSAHTSPSATPAAASTAPRVTTCAWYTPTQPQGQQVLLTATNTGCGAAAPVVEFAAVKLRRVWFSTSPHLDAMATLVAQLHRGATVVRVYMLANPPSPVTMGAAGQLANDLQAAGWVIDVPTGAQGPAPSFSYSTAVGQ